MKEGGGEVHITHQTAEPKVECELANNKMGERARLPIMALLRGLWANAIAISHTTFDPSTTRFDEI
jgi:hypothetical protein